MAGEIRIVEATGGRAYKQFLDLPYRIQGSNPVWVPPLRVQQKELLDPKKNPFFEHAEIRRFLALKDGKPAGRLAAINDAAHNRVHNETTCHFGHFECVDDEAVARALFEAMENAAREWGHNLVRGPFNPSINEDCGLLLDAYDLPPAIMMPYNPPYYPTLVDACGYRKAMDIYSYIVRHDTMTEKLRRGAEAIRKRSKLRFRKFDKKHFWRDAMLIWDIYNEAWAENWCAVPWTKAEFRHLAKNLKTVADFDIVFFAERPEDGKAVGFSLALPNINEAQIRIRDGRLFPFGLLKLLWYTRPGAIHSVRIPVMGVLKEYRGRGIDAVFYYDHYVEGMRKGYREGDIGWILETNTLMIRAAEMMGGKRYKTFRIYEKAL